MNIKSKFITLEGVDGAGKSTHINFIKKYFIDKNLNYNRSLALDKITSITTSIARTQNIELIIESQNYFLSSDNIDLSNEVILKLSEKKFITIKAKKNF